MRLSRFIQAIRENYASENGWFRNYMKRAEVDYYEFWWKFGEWLESHEHEFDDGDVEAARTLYDDGEGEPETLEQMSPEIRAGFLEWCKEDGINYYLKHDPSEAPTWAHASYHKTLPPDTWLVHFSDQNDSIAAQGFKKGVDDMTKLGLTTYRGDSAKKYGGYNFAFIADGRYAKWAASHRKYGMHAVMFQHGGTLIDHHGDEEEQVVFWGPHVDRRNIVQLYSDGDEWVVQARKSGARDPFRGSFEQAVAWVEANARQYWRIISGW